MSHDWWKEISLGEAASQEAYRKIREEPESWTFNAMFAIWGYYVGGGFGDIAAQTAERRSRDYYEISVFDWDRKYLNTVKVNGEPAPDKYALYWACEHLRRGHASFDHDDLRDRE